MKSTTDCDFDIMIVGAGVIGTALASLLSSRKLTSPGRIAVIAPRIAPVTGRPADGWDLRVFALSRASQRVLTAGGAWARLPAHKICAYERMCIWDARSAAPRAGTAPGVGAMRGAGAMAGAGTLVFDCAELGEPDLGFIVDGGALNTQCRAAAAAAGVVFIEATLDAVQVERDAVRVRLDDGRALQGRLLVGADGTGSTTRRLLGIETAGHAYHQDALVAHIRTTEPHRNTAWQRFLPTGPLALLPLSDGRSSIVWSATHAEAARLRALDAAQFGEALEFASDGVLGSCQLTTPVDAYPLKLQYALHYVRPRAVLVGDAAHAVHPLAGQGMNLGLLDCAALAEVLGDAADLAALGDLRVLRRYERWRRSENLVMATAMDALERLFSNDNDMLAGLRIASLGAVARLPPLRRRLAAQALGLTGDLPALVTTDRSWLRK